jgi:hypothetical protein
MEKHETMKNYLISVIVNLPYPREFTFRETCSSAGTAVSRSLRKLRAETRRKKITEYSIKIKKI